MYHAGISLQVLDSSGLNVSMLAFYIVSAAGFSGLLF